MQSENTPAERIAAQFIETGERLPDAARTAPVEVMATAAAYVTRNWGEYGYSLAVEGAGFGWALFRGHSSDGSDFWFIVDRYCNVADVPMPDAR